MRVLLAIPIFNEEKYLRQVLARVREHIDEILVIDDGSTDRTPALLRREPGIYRIVHPENRGYGQSLIDAFAFATDRRYDWLLTMDCDEQHEPAHIREFIAAAEQDDADVISGSRYLANLNGNSAPPPDRRRINAYMTCLLNHLLGLSITDAFCGFKAYRVEALQQVRITEPGYAMPLQFWVQAARAGLRLRELPIKLIYNDPNRHFGGSLDNPDARLRHYLDVLLAELGQDNLEPTPCDPMAEPVCTCREC